MSRYIASIFLALVMAATAAVTIVHNRPVITAISGGAPAAVPNVESFGFTNSDVGLWKELTNIVTISGSSRLLVFFAGGGDSQTPSRTVTNISVGGPSGTGTDCISNYTVHSSTWAGQNCWHLTNPPSGTLTCWVYFAAAGGDHLSVTWLNITNAHQTDPIRGMTNGSGASTAPSLTIASAANDLVASGLTSDDDNTIAISVGGEVFNSGSIGAGGDKTILGVATNTGAANTTITWTTDNEQWAIGAVSVKPP